MTAQAAEELQLSAHQAQYRLAGHYSAYRDDSAALDFDAARRQAFQRVPRVLNAGYSDAAYWLKIRLREHGKPARAWLLDIEVPYPGRVSFYQEVAGERFEYHKGRAVSLSALPYPHRDSVFPVRFDAAGEAEVYLRLLSRDSITLHAKLITEPAFIRADRQAQLFFGLYFGVLLAMAIYNGFLFLSLRDRRYLLYVLFTLSIAVNTAFHFSFFHEYAWAGTPWFNQRANTFFSNLAALAFILFVRRFLSTPRYFPRIDHVLRWCAWWAGFDMVLLLLFDPQAGNIATQVLLPPMLAAVFVAGIRGLKHSGNPARYFLFAFALFMLGVALIPLCRFGLLPPTPLILYTSLLGSIVETLLLSFAVGDQIQHVRREKEAMQKKMLSDARSHNLQLTHMKRALEDTVRERTRKLEQSLAEKEILLKEVHHRVKNNLAVVSSMLGLQQQRTTDARSVALIQAGRERIQAIALIHELLHRTDDYVCIDVHEYLGALTGSLGAAYDNPEQRIQIRFRVEPHKLCLDIDKLIACGLLVNELLTNALKHAFRQRNHGKIDIAIIRQKDTVTLDIADNGQGMAEDTAENLGLELVRIMTLQLGGQISRQSEGGVRCRISFPLTAGD